MVGKSDMPPKMRDKFRISLAKQMSVFNVKKGVGNDEAHLAGSPLTQLTSQENDLMDKNAHLKNDVKCEEIVLCERPFAIVLQVFRSAELPNMHNVHTPHVLRISKIEHAFTQISIGTNYIL